MDVEARDVGPMVVVAVVTALVLARRVRVATVVARVHRGVARVGIAAANMRRGARRVVGLADRTHSTDVGSKE